MMRNNKLKRVLMTSLPLVFLVSSLYGQDARKVVGKVTDASGRSLSGVTVKIKGKKDATATNQEGQFELMVQPNEVLTFSLIGLSGKEVLVGNQSQLQVSLDESDTQMDEVVVVGYGTQRKRDLTGSVASVSAKDVENVPIARADQMIQGRMSGVQVSQVNSQPGGGTSIRIRGTNSINSGNEPLFVVDGFPGAGDLNTINPSDIQSIEVLKDASATAIYGSRGANGVILITTKKGTPGSNAINFEDYYGAQAVRKKLDLMDATAFGKYLNEVQRLNNIETPSSAKALPYSEEQLAQLGKGTNWQDEIFRVAPMQNYQLNFIGGNQETRYNLSMNYFDQQGIVINSGFKRASVRFNLDRKVSEKVNFGFTSQLTRSWDNQALVNTAGGSAGGVILDALRINPAVPVRNEFGEYTFDNAPLGYVSTLGNPVAYAERSKNQFGALRSLLNAFGEYEFLPQLKLRISAGTDMRYVNRSSFIPSDIFLGRNGNGSATRDSGNSVSWVNENTLTYDEVFQDIHALNIVAGVSAQEFHNTNFNITNTNFFTNLLGYENIGIGANVQVPGSGRSKNSLLSYFGRANYRLMDKYLFTVTFRADGSSRFGDNNKFGYFPSGAFAWRVIDESFMKALPTFSDLKLRVGYGVIGNQEIANYASMARYSSNGYTLGGNRVIGITVNNIPNPNLSWESTASTNLGLDLGFLGNRITVTTDVYYKKTKDLLLNVSIPRSTGFASQLINAGSVENKGFEIAINSEHIKKERFTWTTNANLSINRNKVLNLAGEKERFIGSSSGSLFPSGTGGGTNILRVGEPIGSFYGYVFDGIWQSKEQIDASGIKGVLPGDPRYKDLNGDQIIDGNDRQIIGRAQPKFIYGITNDFNFGPVNLNFFIQGVQGVDVLNLNRYELESGDPTTNKFAYVSESWTGEGTSNTLPKVNSTLRRRTGITSDVVENASFIRLKTVSLAYKLPLGNGSLSKTVKSASIYGTAQNLVTWTNYSGYDPEVNSFGTDNSSLNTDYNAYPAARTFILGLRVGF